METQSNQSDQAKYVSSPQRRGQVQSELNQPKEVLSKAQQAATKPDKKKKKPTPKSKPKPKPNPKPNQQRQQRTASQHAQLRQTQRDIPDARVDSVIETGEELSSPQGSSFIDESTHAVVSNDKKTLITVMENKRNTRFDPRNVSKQKERKLLQRIKQEKNNDHALCELAQLYLDGDLGYRDVDQAHQLLLRAADQRNSHAMCLIAGMYEDGDFGTPDLEAAESWLRKSAARGNRYANAVVGEKELERYLAFAETERETAAAKERIHSAIGFFQRAAQKGGTRGMWHLAKIYEEGWGVEKNLSEAIKRYSQAARLGSPASLRELQCHVDDGNLTAEAFEPILSTACRVVAKTSSDLAVTFGVQQLKGELGQNPSRGFWLLESAAANGNTEAMFLLGACFRDGLQCVPDQVKSQHWFKQLKTTHEQAAQRGNMASLIELAELIVDGHLEKVDLANLELMLVHSAKKGVLDVTCFLASLYLKGKIGNHHPDKAIPLMRQTVALWQQKALSGEMNMANRLVGFYLEKDSPLKDYQQAKHWLIHLVKNQHESALFELCVLYLKGKFSKKIQSDQPVFSKGELDILIGKAIDESNPLASFLVEHLHQHTQLLANHPVNLEVIQNNVGKALTAQVQENIGLVVLLLMVRPLTEAEQDISLLIKWLATAACPPTAAMIAVLADRQLTNIMSDSSLSVDQGQAVLQGLLQAAEASDHEPPFRLARVIGDVYFKGKLIPRNIEEACKWYSLAAEQDNNLAMYQLGIVYQEGLLGEVNLTKAEYWFNSSIGRHTVDKLYRLVRSNEFPAVLKTALEPELVKLSQFSVKSSQEMYELGRQHQADSAGNTQRVIRAGFWFRKASNRCHPEASVALAKMFDAGIFGEETRPVAIRFFKRAARQGHPEAMRKMISIFSDGALTAIDSDKADKWQARLTNS